MNVLKSLPRDQDARRLGLASAIALVIFVLQPWLWGSVFDAAAALRDRQTQQQQLANVKQLTEDIRTVDETQQALVDQAAVAFPLIESTPLIVERLEAQAEAQGLSFDVQSIVQSTSPARKKQDLVPFDVEIVSVGEPRSLLAFLESVEHMQELTQLQTWKLEALPADQRGPKGYRLEVKVRLFLQPQL